MIDAITIDGVGPMPVERPTTVAELCAIVRRCATGNTAIYPVGGGTMLDYGMPPARVGVAIATNHLNEVIDYPARDLTITVQAGITMEKLQDTLAAENQWLPIDVPSPEQATIGGAIACDVSGPRRYGYGTLRDYVIGITVVNDRGEETHAGGRVVKNVAGYDFMKLHTGALGTLGVVTQVTLKVKPKPEAYGSVAAPFVPGGQLASVLAATCATKSRPVSIVTYQHNGRGPGWPDGAVETRWSWTVLLNFEGSAEAVRWQEVQAQYELSAVTENVFALPREVAKIDWNAASVPRQSIRIKLPSSLVAEFVVFAGGLWESIGISACVATGVIEITPYNGEQRPDWDATTSARIFRNLFAKTADTGGNVELQHGPATWKRDIPVWGRPTADLALQKSVKRALDPQNLFNPGRFVTEL
jgi:glycolate oxidase FAD binding subunit